MADTPTFASTFAADLETERHTFTVDGQEGFVAVRKMDFGARSQYDMTGVTFDVGGKIAQLDKEKRAAFLISRTVVDYCFWMRAESKETKKPLEPQAVVPPESRKQRELWLEANVARFDGELGAWIEDLCLRVNGLHADQAKNSETPSSD